LGSKNFIDWVRSTFLSVKRTEREIPQLKELKPRPEIEKIVEEVAKHFKVPAERILKSGRKQNVGRDVAIYLSRELSGLSGKALGRHFGGVSGASITMRFNGIVHSLKKDRKLTENIKLLKQKILNT
jgi:chromosomal replication initiator protein